MYLKFRVYKNIWCFFIIKVRFLMLKVGDFVFFLKKNYK